MFGKRSIFLLFKASNVIVLLTIDGYLYLAHNVNFLQSLLPICITVMVKCFPSKAIL